MLTFFTGNCNSEISFPRIIFSFTFSPQRIQGQEVSNSLSMFGQSISSGIDVDNNGYQGKLNNFVYFSFLKE